MFSINFSKAKAKFCLSLHLMVVRVICLLTEKKSMNLKPIIKMSTFKLNYRIIFSRKCVWYFN